MPGEHAGDTSGVAFKRLNDVAFARQYLAMKPSVRWVLLWMLGRLGEGGTHLTADEIAGSVGYSAKTVRASLKKLLFDGHIALISRHGMNHREWLDGMYYIPTGKKLP